MSKKKRLGHFPIGTDAEKESDYEFIPDIKDVEESRKAASESEDENSPPRKSKTFEEMLSEAPEQKKKKKDKLAETEEVDVSNNFRKSLADRFQAFADYMKK